MKRKNTIPGFYDPAYQLSCLSRKAERFFNYVKWSSSSNSKVTINENTYDIDLAWVSYGRPLRLTEKIAKFMQREFKLAPDYDVNIRHEHIIFYQIIPNIQFL